MKPRQYLRIQNSLYYKNNLRKRCSTRTLQFWLESFDKHKRMGEDSAFFRKSLQQQIFHLSPQDLPAISTDFQKTEPIIRGLIEQYGAIHIYRIGLFVAMRRLQNPELELDVEG
mmetsp:Transcript_12827/g.35573  ORF Transcript_12827/g.35573 Transcript_12827/m.35573 type:complete len:114 (-) Transcript_12827:280-621(-)